MEINVYQQCPCHSEKKIKFCCGKDIVGSLNEVLEKHDAGQTAAALESVNRVIGRVGDKDCLAVIKFKLLMALGQIGDAETVNEAFLASNSNHPLGLQNRAMISLAKGDLPQSVDALQDAIDNVAGNVIPASFAKPFQTVGLALLETGHPLAAREYFLAALRFNPEFEVAKELLPETFGGTGAMILLKRMFSFPEVPIGDAPWIKKYENVLRALRRGQFRKAQQIMARVKDLAPTERVVLTAAAHLSNFFLDIEGANRAWREYSKATGLQPAERVEAEALAQMFRTSVGPKFDFVRVVYEIDDLDTVSALALSHPQFVQTEFQDDGSEENTPPPRFNFILLDRDRLPEGSPFFFDTTPRAIGEVRMYGRQTDRSPRVEWLGVRDENFDRWQIALREILKLLPETPTQTTVHGQVAQFEYAQSISWNIPHKTSRTDYLNLLREQAIRYMTGPWIDSPNPALDGKSPREVMGDPNYQLRLQALMLTYQLEQEPRPWVAEVVDTVARELQIEPVPLLDLSQKKLETVSPALARFVDLDALSQLELQSIFMLAVTSGHYGLVLTVGRRLLGMDFDQTLVSKDLVYVSLATFTPNDDECFELLHQARKAAKTSNRPIGNVLISEFEQRLLRSRFEGLRRIFHEIQTSASNDPEIEQRFANLLAKYGLLTRDGKVMLPPEQPAAPAETASKLWTPDGSGAGNAPPAAEAEPRAGLWIPGS